MAEKQTAMITQTVGLAIIYCIGNTM